MINKIQDKLLYAARTNKVINFFGRVLYAGKSRYCPICGSYYRKFLPFGVKKRKDAMCLTCGSLERHRLIWKFFKNDTNLFDDSNKKRMLHVAPEKIFIKIFKRNKNIDYLTGDLNDSNAMVKMDITNIKYPKNQFDCIYCSHVLEHVQDDYKAMKELHRVLKPGGWAVLQVPVTADKTVEDPSVTDPNERERLFGQYNHVRRYGLDYIDRLKKSGFEVQVINAVDIVGEDGIDKMGIIREDNIFYCKK